MVLEKYENGIEYVLFHNEWVERIRKTPFSAKCKCGKEITIDEYYSLHCCYECYVLGLLENEIKILRGKKGHSLKIGDKKLCNRCNELQSLDSFWGRDAICKKCRAQIRHDKNLLKPKKIKPQPTQEELELKEQQKLLKKEIAKQKQKEKNKIKTSNKRMAKLSELNPEFTIDFQTKNPDKTICLMCFNIVDLKNMANTKRCNDCQEVWFKDFIVRKNKQKRDNYNPEKQHEYYLANKDTVWKRFHESPKRKAYDRQYYQDNYDRIADYRHAYIKTPSGKLTSLRGRMKRLNYLKNRKNDFTPEEFLEIIIAQNYKCLYCGKEFTVEEFTPDHIVPLSKGGENTKINIQALCRSCNCRKNNKIDSPAMELILKGLQ